METTEKLKDYLKPADEPLSNAALAALVLYADLKFADLKEEDSALYNKLQREYALWRKPKRD